MDMVEVIVYSKPDCHLCEDLKQQVLRLQAQRGFKFREVNILDDPETYERFKTEIPVVFINGKKAFKYRLDEKEFLNRLEREERNPRAT